MELTLARIIVVNKLETLDPEFIDYYYPEVDMYVFFSEATYDTRTGSYHGVVKLHDKLYRELGLPSYLDETNMNYISIDIKPSDKRHTYMSINTRWYQLTEEQRQFLAEMFDVDYF